VQRGSSDRGSVETRVAFIYGDYPPKPKGEADGGADFIQQLARRLVQRGIGVTAIVSERKDRPERFGDQGVHVAPIIKGWRLRQSAWSEVRRLRQLVKEEGINVVHLFYPDPYIRYGSDSYHLPFLLKTLGRPLVVTLFGFGVTRSNIVTRVGLFGLFASANSLVITDWDLVARFNHRFPFWNRKTSGGLVGSIARNDSPRWSSSELSRRRAALGYEPEGRYIGFFGFWLPGKGLEELIKAVAALRAAGDPLRLVLIGGREAEHRSDYETSLLQEVRRAGIDDAVIETGPLPADEVSAHLVAMDACVLPFQANPLGRSSLALALTLGVPTAVTRPLERTQLLDGIPVLDLPDAEHIIAAVRLILSSRSVQEQYARASFAAARHWSWDSVVDEYIEIYARLRQQR
jgi:glycosyltransferase involved in cell wall biosynthesis